MDLDRGHVPRAQAKAAANLWLRGTGRPPEVVPTRKAESSAEEPKFEWRGQRRRARREAMDLDRGHVPISNRGATAHNHAAYCGPAPQARRRRGQAAVEQARARGRRGRRGPAAEAAPRAEATPRADEAAPSLSEATSRAETAPCAATARQALASKFRIADAEATEAAPSLSKATPRAEAASRAATARQAQADSAMIFGPNDPMFVDDDGRSLLCGGGAMAAACGL